MDQRCATRQALFVIVLLLSFSSCAPSNAPIDPGFAAVPIPDSVPASDKALTVTGLAGPRASVDLDLKTIMKFPAASFALVDPWDGKRHEFTGVALHPLLRRLGLPGDASVIEVAAANDYRIDIRMSDLAAYGYLLVYRMDGVLTGAGSPYLKRGALSIAVDFPAHRELDVEVYKHQLVWQVTTIAVKRPGK